KPQLVFACGMHGEKPSRVTCGFGNKADDSPVKPIVKGPPKKPLAKLAPWTLNPLGPTKLKKVSDGKGKMTKELTPPLVICMGAAWASAAMRRTQITSRDRLSIENLRRVRDGPIWIVAWQASIAFLRFQGELRCPRSPASGYRV